MNLRLRLALFSGLLAGVALVCFALVAWGMIKDSQIAGLDVLLRAAAEREVPYFRVPEQWEHYRMAVARLLANGDGEKIMLWVLDQEGDTLYLSSNWTYQVAETLLQWPQWQAQPIYMDPFGMPPDLLPPPPPAFALQQLRVGGKDWHVAMAVLPHARFAVGCNLDSIYKDLAAVTRAFLYAVPLVVLPVGLGAWLFSGRAMRSIGKLTKNMREVSAQGLGQRLIVAKTDPEIGELIAVFNEMLARLERSFLQASRFSADAAHELKTPLAILQGQVESALHETEAGSDLQIRLAEILAEIRHLSEISRKLLLLSLADAGKLNVQRETLDLSAIVEDLAEDTKMLAPHLALKVACVAGLRVSADAGLLRQVLYNLISNAVKYNQPGGWISICAKSDGHFAEVAVANACIEIPKNVAERLFERFFRGGDAFVPEQDGVGLGLSLSREIARAHSGDLILKKNESGMAEFSLLLPSAV